MLGQADKDIGGIQRVSKIVLYDYLITDIDHRLGDAVEEINNAFEARVLKIPQCLRIASCRFDFGDILS